LLDLVDLNAALADAASAAWERFWRTLDDTQRARIDAWLTGHRREGTELARVFALSEFASDVAVAQPDAFIHFLVSEAFAQPLGPTTIDRVDGIESLQRALRRQRNLALLHIIWRDLNGRAQVEETTASLTQLADRLIDAALSRLHEWAVERDGEPIGADSRALQRLVVIALGKLGAGELNLSSDVDLMFTYPEDGETHTGARTNHQFFTRLGQKLIQVLDAVTADGFVFRVDMRLRPYGDSGALVLGFDAMLRYYEEQGRDWERYAWIRARPCAGDVRTGANLIDQLKPFVFRRYLDFGAVQSLREMKGRIDAERGGAAMRDNVKLGPGGIREVEFTAQVHQLIWAGRHPALQCRGVVATLSQLVTLELLSGELADRLAAAYRYLRNVEHRLQAIRDEQTQLLPTGALDRLRVANGMGCADYPQFLTELERHRANTSLAFETLMHARTDDPAESFRAAWLRDDAPALAAELSASGFGDAAELTTLMARLYTTRDRPRVSAESRARLDALIPWLLAAASQTSRAGVALARLVPLLEATVRRSAYYMLLLENPAALRLLVEICAASRWLADELSRYPMLLDELLDPALMYTIPDIAALRRDLRARLAQVQRGGEEAELEALRTFKETHQFRVAACELRGILPLMNVSDYLTFLAEVILQESLRLAWQRTVDATAAAPGAAFAIIGFGKLGGIELGPGSDLDIVFLHDLDDDHHRFLHRVVRRLLHILTTRTHAGALYDVDTRLRPSGGSGTMVSSVAAFERYQQHDAWTWEHQALVRARPVGGDAAVCDAFQRIRREILCRVRDRRGLREEILDMRRRIGEGASAGVDVKREPGGIVDIEFMVQYLVLAWASEHPSLADWTDNVRILETAATVGLLDAGTAAALKDAYLALRSERHREALDIPDDGRAREVLDRYGSLIREQWNRLLKPGDADR
jgi:glutamate-ammonia-ligase adenylyltransferase